MAIRRLFTALRASFLTGLVVVAPAVVTIWVITGAVDFIDGQVLPLIPTRFLPASLQSLDVPGMGVVIFLVFTLGVGWLAKGWIGRTLIAISETIVSRMPVVRSIYNGLKQIAETVFAQSDAKFDHACMIEYPRPGVWAIGFVSTRTRGEIAHRHDRQMLSVFLPTTPNPTSGFLLFVPEEDVTLLDMSVEDAAKLVISAGLVTPESLPQRVAPAKS